MKFKKTKRPGVKAAAKTATVLSYTAVRNDLANKMQQVCDDSAPIVITRQDADSCVLMSLDDYLAIEETAYLLRSPANSKRLLDSIEQVSKGKFKTRKVAA
jgi:antitoxin YefM